MAFTKLDSGILDSSIWEEPEYIRVVWFAFLAKKDHNGFVASTYKAMRRTSNLTDDESGQKFAEAIKCLESPDPDSRTKDNDGRRIKRIEGGWVVLNHFKYREFSYSNNPESVKKRIYREKRGQKGTCPRMSGDMHGHSVSVSESVSVSVSEKRGDTKGGKKIFASDSEPYQLAKKFEASIIKQNSEYRKQTRAGLQRWAADFDKMMRIDKRTPQEIRDKIDGIRGDTFWAPNILSAGKMRLRWNEGKLSRIRNKNEYRRKLDKAIAEGILNPDLTPGPKALEGEQ